MTNCPNCGAPITGSQCPFCGTRFDIEVRGCLSEIISENEKLKAQSRVQDLYAEAQRAMRLYASGIMTPNEIRETCGLEPI